MDSCVDPVAGGARGAQLLREQRRLTRRLQRSIQRLLGPAASELRRYERSYRRQLGGLEQVLTLEALADTMDRAEVVLCGDFHSFSQAQRAALRLLRRLVTRRRRWTLCLEALRAVDQPLLDRYQAGGLDDAEFLEAVEFHRRWGFDWSNYRPLLEFARQHGIEVRGIDTARPQGLERRDAAMARQLARLQTRHPERGMLVLVGDLHLAASHLPARLMERLPHTDIVRIFQNVEQIYWQLAERGLDHGTQAVALSDGSYCLLSGTPWTKLESYLQWIEGCGTTAAAASSLGLATDTPQLTDEVLDAAYLLTRLLGLRRQQLDGLAVYCADPGGFQHELRARRSRLANAGELLVSTELWVDPQLELVHLRRYGINHRTQAAAELLHLKATRSSASQLLHGRGAFQRRLLLKTLGYLGSKLLNPKRHPGRALNLPIETETADPTQLLVARYAHSLVASLLAPGLRGTARLRKQIAADDLQLELAISSAVGRILGERLFRAVRDGRLDGERLRGLFLHAGGGWAPLRRIAALQPAPDAHSAGPGLVPTVNPLAPARRRASITLTTTP